MSGQFLNFGKNAPDLPDEARKECVNFLKWVGDDHFMFIGARTYDIVQKGNVDTLKVVDGTGLGLLREDAKTVLSRPIASATGETRFNPNAPLIVTKANTRSPMHRSGYMDYIGVLRFDENGKVSVNTGLSVCLLRLHTSNGLKTRP